MMVQAGAVGRATSDGRGGVGDQGGGGGGGDGGGEAGGDGGGGGAGMGRGGGGGGGGGGFAGEGYESTPASHKYFMKFWRRIARDRRQCIRYAYDGRPLW